MILELPVHADVIGDTLMQAFQLSSVLAERDKNGRAYLEFLRVTSLSMGIYHLKAGQADLQKPHTEDEVYYVVSGRAQFRAGDAVENVEPGTLIFVDRLVEHRFFNIADNLTVLVFFAPAEGSS
jgi:mannose-6-phosphate isomerase-like protein (cupin superfamily)